MIFQLLDDHSRYAVASHVAWGETSDAAIAVFDKAVAAHGVPQRLLSDNGGALNPSRRGVLGQFVVHLMAWVSSRSPASPTSRPPRARTSGSIRPCSATSTSSRWLPTLAELQAQVDAFDEVYNTQRPHQGLPGRVTPQAAWEATAKAEAPRPTRERFRRPLAHHAQPVAMPADLGEDTARQEVDQRWHVHAGEGLLQRRCPPRLPADLGDRRGRLPGDKITVTDLEAEVLIEHTRPAPGITYVGNGRPRGPRRER